MKFQKVVAQYDPNRAKCSNSLFYLSSRPKLKDIQFTIMIKKSITIITFKEPGNVGFL